MGGFNTSGRKPITYQLQIRGGVDTPATLTGTLQLTDRSANFQFLDGGAADREVRMPATNRDGVIFRIVNAGATNDLLLKDSAGTNVLGTTALLTPSQAAWVVNEGGSWLHLGRESITL